MNSNQVKNYLKSLGHSTVRVRTIPGKSQWIHAWIPSDKGNPMVLTYSQPAFSLDLRKAAVKSVYGQAVADDYVAQNRISYGNISGYSISMLGHQWAVLIPSTLN